MKVPLIVICIVVLASPFSSIAGETKPNKQPIDLNLPSFRALPKGEELVKPHTEKMAAEPTVTPASASYSVVRVSHAKKFTRAPGGAVPAGGALETIPISGSPPSTERFTTVVRVKSPQRASAPIEIVILDPRGNTAMSASGEVNFRGTKQDEVDYTVDWDPTPTRSGGTFQMLIRVGGLSMGTWPLKVAEVN